MAEKHPELGTITDAEVNLIKEHRERTQRVRGWEAGVRAMRHFVVNNAKEIEVNGVLCLQIPSIPFCSEGERLEKNPPNYL